MSKSGGPFASYALSYDGGANKARYLTGVAEAYGSVVAYGYNGLYRLTGESHSGTAADSASYGYDAAGNPSAGGAGYDGANTSSLNSYDGDGNPTSYALGGAAVAMSWSDSDDLLSMTTPAGTLGFANSEGMRIGEGVGAAGRFFIYNGDMLIGEVDQAGHVFAAYTWGAAGLVSEHRYDTVAPASFYYAFDAQGATRQLTDASGTVADTYAYSAYGVPLASTGTDPNPMRYGGQAGYYTDASADGLVRCGQRWYDPVQERWLSQDPIGYDGGADLYAYCGGNPVGGIDPSGCSVGSWIDRYLLGGSIRRWGYTQGLYDSGRATYAQRNWAAVGGSTQVVLLASSAVGIGGIIKGGAKIILMAAGRRATTRLCVRTLSVAADDEGFYMLNGAGPSGTMQVLATMAKTGDTLTLGEAEIEGPGAGKVGIAELRQFAQMLGKMQGVSKVVINGSRRSTGLMKGKVPSPITFTIN